MDMCYQGEEKLAAKLERLHELARRSAAQRRRKRSMKPGACCNDCRTSLCPIRDEKSRRALARSTGKSHAQPHTRRHHQLKARARTHSPAGSSRSPSCTSAASPPGRYTSATRRCRGRSAMPTLHHWQSTIPSSPEAPSILSVDANGTSRSQTQD